MAQNIVSWGGAGKTTPADTNYTHGSAKNVSAPGAGDGTPWVAPFVNQLEAFFQRIMDESSTAYNGNVDTVPTSQFYAAADSLWKQTTGWRLQQEVTTTGATNFTVSGIPTTINAVMIRYANVNFGTADRPIFRMLNSGTPVTTGYENSILNWDTGIGRAASTTEVEPGRVDNTPGSNTHSGLALLVRVGSLNQWNFTSDATLSGLASWTHTIGFSPAITTMDGVQILSKSGNSFTGGTVAVYYQ